MEEIGPTAIRNKGIDMHGRSNNRKLAKSQTHEKSKQQIE